MKLEISTSININATPETVWNTLMDFEAYPNWNPFIHSIEGEAVVGKQLKVKFPGMTFTPIVVAAKKNKEFRWLGKLFFKGLFDGEHGFTLIDLGNGMTRFEHDEKFNGILVSLLKKKLQTEVVADFKAMNEQLKVRAEASQHNLAHK